MYVRAQVDVDVYRMCLVRFAVGAGEGGCFILLLMMQGTVFFAVAAGCVLLFCFFVCW